MGHKGCQPRGSHAEGPRGTRTVSTALDKQPPAVLSSLASPSASSALLASASQGWRAKGSCPHTLTGMSSLPGRHLCRSSAPLHRCTCRHASSPAQAPLVSPDLSSGLSLTASWPSGSHNNHSDLCSCRSHPAQGIYTSGSSHRRARGAQAITPRLLRSDLHGTTLRQQAISWGQQWRRMVILVSPTNWTEQQVTTGWTRAHGTAEMTAFSGATRAVFGDSLVMIRGSAVRRQQKRKGWKTGTPLQLFWGSAQTVAAPAEGPVWEDPGHDLPDSCWPHRKSHTGKQQSIPTLPSQAPREEVRPPRGLTTQSLRTIMVMMI